MDFLFDKTKIQGPAPGSFEANILRSITVPYQTIITSGGQYPVPAVPNAQPVPGPPVLISLKDLGALPSFRELAERLNGKRE